MILGQIFVVTLIVRIVGILKFTCWDYLIEPLFKQKGLTCSCIDGKNNIKIAKINELYITKHQKEECSCKQLFSYDLYNGQ